jgi:hypothetical protein
MTEQRRRPTTQKAVRKKRGISSLLVWVLLLAGLPAAMYFGWLKLSDSSGPQLEDFATSVGIESSEISGDRAVVLVFPTWDASSYVTELRQISSRNRQGEDLLSIVGSLCQGPEVSGTVSALPDGTEALAAFYNGQTSTVVLDFSQHLVTGHPGGSAAESATLTSILRTVSLNFPEIKECVILVDGSQVETLAGHLNLDHPFILRRWM